MPLPAGSAGGAVSVMSRPFVREPEGSDSGEVRTGRAGAGDGDPGGEDGVCRDGAQALPTGSPQAFTAGMTCSPYTSITSSFASCIA
ncbi:hypothetical protein GCM10009646_74770 [Streptomyces aureus]